MDDSGDLICAVSEERLTRKKHDGGFPRLAIRKCLLDSGFSSKDRLFIGYTNYESDDVVRWATKFLPDAVEYMKEDSLFKIRLEACEDPEFLSEQRERMGSFPNLHTKEVSDLICNYFSHIHGIHVRKIGRHKHHACHAVSSFYNSPFKDQAAIFSLDGFGDGESGGVYIINECAMQRLSSNPTSGSMGLMYQFVTGQLGYKELDAEWKLLGHEPFGDPNKFFRILKDIFKIEEDERGFSRIIGRPIKQFKKLDIEESPIKGWREYNEMKNYIRENVNGNITDLDFNEVREDWSASVQSVLEHTVIEWMLRNLQKIEIDNHNICLTGGVFMNVKLNRLIRICLPTWNVFVNPSSTDAGCSIGAAVLTSGNSFLNKRRLGAQSMLIGPGALNEEFEKSVSQEDKIVRIICDKLKEGRYVCVVNGRSEFGPRALMNRSILYDSTKDSYFLNVALDRTAVMPFAGSMLRQFAGDLLSDWKETDVSDEYMTMTYLASKEMSSDYKSICHPLRKGIPQMTTRPQVVSAPGTFAYALLKRWFLETQKKSLLNTSFNGHGEPIVENYSDALLTFRDMVVRLKDHLYTIKGTLVANDLVIDEEDLDV